VGDPDVFAQELWSQRPQHLPAAGSFEDLLSLDDVDRIVSTMGLRLPAFRLVKDGETLPPARYTKTTRTGSQEATGVIDARAVFAEFDAGATVVFQSMHRYWEPLADYCRSLEIAFGYPVQANAYITPQGARGFGAHEDSHDVFVLQSYGAKQWQVHDRHDLPPSRPPLIDDLVASGDTLYIPAGFPHSASTQERASAHITIGILALRWSDLVKETVRLLETDPALDEPLPLRFAAEEGSFTEEVQRRLQRFSSSVAGVDPEVVTRRLRRRVLTTRQPLLRGQIHRLLTLDEVDDETTVTRRPGSICVLDQVEGELSALLGDRELRLPLLAEPAMSVVAAEQTLVVGDLPGLDEPGRLVLVRRLIREGLLEVVV
jgi:bifunctional lysine-specific demethylase and histidyl-hydroxylase NO66